VGKLFFDIETLPAPEEKRSVIKEIYDRQKVKKEQLGQEFNQTFDQYFQSTALTGAFGRLLCIGYAIDNQPVEILTGSERDQLKAFWELARVHKPLIGHNIMDFDIPFLKQRSIVTGIKSEFLSLARYKNFPLFDTKYEWDGWGKPSGWASLDTIAHALDLPSSKGAIDGSKVAEFYEKGKIEEIYNYCKADVELTRKIYCRLTFTDFDQQTTLI
jgi:predicted PolB exonuclease-like 3'-5' exonuclease